MVCIFFTSMDNYRYIMLLGMYVCMHMYMFSYDWMILNVLSLVFGRLHLGSWACAPLSGGAWSLMAASRAFACTNLESWADSGASFTGFRGKSPPFFHDFPVKHGDFESRILDIMGFTMEFSLGFTDWSNKRRPGQSPIVRGNSCFAP